MKSYHLFLCFLVFSSASVANNRNGNFPKEVSSIAMENSCKEISDYYMQEGQMYPPFVFGIVYGVREENSVALICEKFSSKDEYILTIGIRENPLQDFKQFTNCPSIIEMQDFFGGLRRNSKSEKAKIYISEDKKEIEVSPKSIEASFSILKDEIEFEYICSEGEWLYRFYH